MPKTIKNTFSGGELSTDLEGRIDIAKYATGAQLMQNFYPTRFGGVDNRPGTEFVGLCPWQTGAYRRLVPFQFSVRQSYMLEFSGRTIEYLDSFDSTIQSDIWNEGEEFVFGGGNASTTNGALQSNALSYPIGGVGYAVEYGDFEYSGTMSYPDFPDGSASNVWLQNQSVSIAFNGLETLEFGFANSNAFSATGYKGYNITSTVGGAALHNIDATDFTNIAWSVSKVGTAIELVFAGVTYNFTLSDNSAILYTMTLKAINSNSVPPEFGTASWSSIQIGTDKADSAAQDDNIMRVVKNAAPVLTSRVSSNYQWNVSGSGTDEYYCQLVGGGDPLIPGAVELWEDGTQMDEGTLGSLALNEWAWGDNDSLGFGTIYVRITGGADPDSKSTGYLQSDYQLDTSIFGYNLDEMTYAQSADTMFLAGNFAPKKLVRSADDNWAITDLVFTPSVPEPLDFYTAITGFTATDRKTSYLISNVNEESIESLPSTEIQLDLQLAWPEAGRVDLYWNNITDGLESTPIFEWIASASGTAEYYCQLVGGGDPSISEPEKLWEDKSEATRGEAGSLALGEWDYADNDSLGYTTTYIRLSDGLDPDTKAVGHVTYKKSTDSQWRVYKNLRADVGWLGDVDVPWYLDDVDIEPDVNVAPKGNRDPFNTGDTDDWPYAVGIFEQRLVYARSNNNPQRVWTSVSGDLTNFSTSRPLSSEDPITVRLVSGGRVDEIRHLLPLQQLLVLTTGSEWTLTNGENSDSLTPFSVQFRNQGYEGVSRSVQPVGIGNQAVFIQRNNRDIRTTSFNLQDAGYASEELNLLAQHLFEDREVVDWCYQQHPSNLVWMVMSDGDLVSMTYLPEQQLIAFSRHDTQGEVKATGSLVTTGDDKVYYIVERDTGTFIEVMSSREWSHVRDAKFLDSALSYNPKLDITNVVVTATETTVYVKRHGYSNGDKVLIDNVEGIVSTGIDSEYATFNEKYYLVAGAATDNFQLETLASDALTDAYLTGTYKRNGNSWKTTLSVSGFDHLEGETVSVLADGSAIGKFVVASGSITLGTFGAGYGVVHAGLAYTCNLQTMRLDLATQTTTQWTKKNLKKLILRFKDSSGGWAGPSEDRLTLIKWRTNESWAHPNDLKTEDVPHNMKATWDREGRTWFQQPDPLPTTILALITELELGDH